MKIEEIKKLPRGSNVSGVFRLREGRMKTTNKGKPYADLVLADASDSLAAKFWDAADNPNTESILAEVRKSGLVYAELVMDSWEKTPQGKIVSFRPVSPADSFDLAELTEPAKVDAEAIYQELCDLVEEKIRNEKLYQAIRFLLEWEKDKLKKSPAAMYYHHAYPGGLLHHVFRMAQMADKLADVYPEVNRSLLIAGVIVHDLGKIYEYEHNDLGDLTGFTTAGNLLSHNVFGVGYLYSLFPVMKKHGVDSQTLIVLCHMMESHHGKPEWGSAVEPKFLEARLLHYLDQIDACIPQFEKACQSLLPGEQQQSKDSGLKIHVYRPDFPEDRF